MLSTNRWVRPAHLSTLTVSDMVVSLGLFFLALALRLPYLTTVPFYTDEGSDVLWGWDVVIGRHLPLTSVDAYKGPLWTYLMAALFYLLGPNQLWPRLTAAIAGALLVVATYMLGRLMGNRLTGLVAAGLTLTNPTLVVFNSHYGWPDCLTTCLCMLTLLTLYAGVTRNRAWLVVASGACGALALQTHPTSATVLVGALVWFLAQPDARQWLRRPAPYLAVGLLLLVYAPVLIAMASNSTRFVTETTSRAYAFSLVTSPTDYVARVASLLKYLFYVVGGIIPPPTPGERITELVLGGLLLLGLVVAWQRQARLIHAVFVAVIVLMPLALHGFSPRYFGVLIPLSYIAIGLLATEVTATNRLALGKWGIGPTPLLAPVTLLLCALLTLYPLVSISGYYRYAYTVGETNEEVNRLSQLLRSTGACGPRLYVVDPPTNASDTSFSGPTAAQFIIHYVLTLDGCEHNYLALDAVQSLAPGAASAIIVPEAIQASLGSLLPATATFALPMLDTLPTRVVLYQTR